MNIASPHQPLDLVSAIAEGDIRCLLMVLVHMTGDELLLKMMRACLGENVAP